LLVHTALLLSVFGQFSFLTGSSERLDRIYALTLSGDPVKWRMLDERNECLPVCSMRLD
jgi:hypothetical protein